MEELRNLQTRVHEIGQLIDTLSETIRERMNKYDMESMIEVTELACEIKKLKSEMNHNYTRIKKLYKILK